MTIDESVKSYNRARLDDRQVTELIGIARGLIADDILNDDEIDFLRRWLVASEVVSRNPIVIMMEARLAAVLDDGIVDDEERFDLMMLLKKLVSNDFEIGELIRSSTLPLCKPPPHVEFDGRRFCFTGTFGFGSRRDCERAVLERGGEAGSLTQRTRYLVIGEYATDSWVQSPFGRKIERAVEMRERGSMINIVSEAHWRTSLW